MKTNNKSGFSLLELLVVVSIIAVLIGLALPNFIGARERARDTRRKAELNELKKALRLYYNDFETYPATGTGTNIVGCGTNGDQACPVAGPFQAGGASGDETMYMKRLPQGTYFYTRAASGDDFRLRMVLDNRSDPDLTTSQAQCPPLSGTYGATDYVVCAD